MYDVCLGNASNVLMTVMDEEAAVRLVDAVKKEKDYLYQAEGCDPFFRKVDRSGEKTAPAQIEMKVEEEEEAVEEVKEEPKRKRFYPGK